MPQQAEPVEPVAADAAYQRWLEDTHAPALRRMDSRAAFSAGWQAAALAQQAEPVEPVAWANIDRDRLRVDIDEAIAALRTALAQQAEPVAWMYTGIKQDGTEHGPHLVWKPEYMDAMSASKGAKATPLYTTPPRQSDPRIEQAMLGMWQDVPGAVNFGITDPQIADRLARHGIPAP